MTKLKVVLKSDKKNTSGRVMYQTEVNAHNYKDLALVFRDLENMGIPLKEAIKESMIKKSPFDLILGS